MMERIGKIGTFFQKLGKQNRRINTPGTLKNREVSQHSISHPNPQGICSKNMKKKQEK